MVFLTKVQREKLKQEEEKKKKEEIEVRFRVLLDSRQNDCKHCAVRTSSVTRTNLRRSGRGRRKWNRRRRRKQRILRTHSSMSCYDVEKMNMLRPCARG